VPCHAVPCRASVVESGMRLISAERSERKYAFAGTSAKIACSACVNPKHTLVSHSIRCTATKKAESTAAQRRTAESADWFDLTTGGWAGLALLCLIDAMLRLLAKHRREAWQLGRKRTCTRRSHCASTAAQPCCGHAPPAEWPVESTRHDFKRVLGTRHEPCHSRNTYSRTHVYDVCALSKGVEPKPKQSNA
jgi:hypothetical protein